MALEPPAEVTSRAAATPGAPGAGNAQASADALVRMASCILAVGPVDTAPSSACKPAVGHAGSGWAAVPAAVAPHPRMTLSAPARATARSRVSPLVCCPPIWISSPCGGAAATVRVQMSPCVWMKAAGHESVGACFLEPKWLHKPLNPKPVSPEPLSPKFQTLNTQTEI